MKDDITPVPMIYANLFSAPNPDPTTLASYIAMANDLAGSGFVVVNLWQVHVDPAGDLLMNAAAPAPAMISGGALQSDFSYVPQVLGALTGTGSKVTTVRATIGGWGLDNTFDSMVQLVNQYGTTSANPLYGNFAALKILGISGIDLDLEPLGGSDEHDYPYYIGPLAQVIQMAAAAGLDATFCPYQNENFWLTLLAAVYAQGGEQPVQSMNVQCYAGGTGNTPRKWIDGMHDYHKLKISLHDFLADIFGIQNAESFVVPGLGVLNDGKPQCPSEIEHTLTRLEFARKGITSAYLFDYGAIQNIQQSGQCPNASSTADFANALIDGINKINHRIL